MLRDTVRDSPLRRRTSRYTRRTSRLERWSEVRDTGSDPDLSRVIVLSVRYRSSYRMYGSVVFEVERSRYPVTVSRREWKRHRSVTRSSGRVWIHHLDPRSDRARVQLIDVVGRDSERVVASSVDRDSDSVYRVGNGYADSVSVYRSRVTRRTSPDREWIRPSREPYVRPVLCSDEYGHTTGSVSSVHSITDRRYGTDESSATGNNLCNPDGDTTLRMDADLRRKRHGKERSSSHA